MDARISHGSSVAALFLATLALGGCTLSGSDTTPSVTPTPYPPGYLYVVESGLNRVDVLDESSGAILNSIPVGNRPIRMADAGSNTPDLYVANENSNTVSVIDPATETVTHTIPVGPQPIDVGFGITMPGPGLELHVLDAGNNSVQRIDLATFSPGPSIAVGRGASALIDNNYTFVANTTDGTVSVIGSDANGAMRIEATLPVGTSPSSLAYGGSGGGIVVGDAADGRIYEVAPNLLGSGFTTTPTPFTIPGLTRLTNLSTLTSDNFCGKCGIGALTPTTFAYFDRHAWNNAFHLVQPPTAPVTVGALPYDTASDGDDYAGTVNQRIFVSNYTSNTISVIQNGAVVNTFHLPAGAQPTAMRVLHLIRPSGPVPTASPTATPSASPTASPTATPASGSLYIADEGTPASITGFALPLSGASTPAFASSEVTPPLGLAVDAAHGRMAVQYTNGVLAVVQLPYGASGGTLVAAIANATGGGTGQVAFDASGDLFAATLSNTVNEYAPPFVNNQTPTKVITGGGLAIDDGVAVDAGGTLYASNLTNGVITAFAPPYATGVAVTAAGGAIPTLTAHGGQLFVGTAAGQIAVFTLPLSSSSVPVFTITAPQGNLQGIAFDSNGTMYVTSGNGALYIYGGTLGAASTPALTLTTGLRSPHQLAVAP